ncbi:MAG: tetratricopeptide repeat protein [Isosphaeraceae bacterium]
MSGWEYGLAEDLVRACLATIIMLSATAQLRAQAEADWVGKRVVPRTREFVLRVDDEPVEASRNAMAIYRVERIDDGPLLWLQAEAQRRLNGWTKVEDVIPVDRVIDVYTDQIRAHPKDAFAHAMRALVREDKQEYAEALRDYDQAIRLDPGNAAYYRESGDIRSLMNEADKAISDYNEAIRLDPRSDLALAGRGKAWAMMNNHDRAIEDFSEAIWLDPLGLAAYLARGSAWQAKGENQKAIIDYNMVIRLDPENIPAYIRRARAWKASRAYARAVADFEHAVQIDAKQPIALEGLAWIRATCPDAKIRDGKKAVEAATKACEMTLWKDARCLATLAAAHAEAGDFDSAMKWQATANARSTAADEKTQGERRLALYREKTPYREPEP